ncbi:MAG: DNA-directed RNA polymerase subunit B'', partial [Euryarchaeota archaeon]
LKYQLERHHNRKRELRINACLRPDVLTQKIMHALATGNWVGGRSGVSQLLDRTTYLAALSHMRRVTSPLVRSQPHFEARDLHPTQWGRLCPNETPEGQNCGLVKNASQMIDVSEEVHENEVKQLLSEAGVDSSPAGWVIFSDYTKTPLNWLINSSAEGVRDEFGQKLAYATTGQTEMFSLILTGVEY